jgi:four helix bundle protein
MKIVSTFRDLDVYRLAREANREIFAVTKTFPREERYAAIDQIRRCSRATKALIAEAWGRRRYKSVFTNKLDEALGEANEVLSWLDDAVDCEYIAVELHEKMIKDWHSITAKISRMIDRASDFCRYDSDMDYRSVTQETPVDLEFPPAGD